MQYFIDGEVRKAAIAFISDDRGHGWEQIEDFNKRTFEILSEFGLEIKNWTRMSDGCASQYKSKYSILKLTESREMMEKVTKNQAGTVRFELFGSYEGKNESDALGSLVKNILDRAINKDRDGAISINNAEDAVEVINREKPEASTNKYCLWRVEKVPPTVRNPKPNGIPIKGIRKLHSFSYSGAGIRAARLSCNLCTVSKDCNSCSSSADTVSSSKILEARCNPATNEDDCDEDQDLEVESLEENSDEDLSEDEEDENVDEEGDSESEEEDLFLPGDVVWALFSRQWFCAQVVSLDDVPRELHRQLKNIKEDALIVKFYVCKSFCRVPVTKIENLGETLVDKKRMLKHPQAYLEALGDKSYNY